MSFFEYQSGRLCAEQVAVEEIARQWGTPCYVYSRAAIRERWLAFDRAFADHPHLICYAVKANSNLAVLQQLAQLGSGFDIVSLGEMRRVLQAGGQAQRIVFSGVGKREDEIVAALQAGIRCFNVEVADELERINRLAGQLGLIAPVSFRVNPDVDAQTHPYISTGLKENKFGIDNAIAVDLYRHAANLPHIRVVGIDCHIGSQLTSLTPFLDALDKVLSLVDQLAKHGIELEHIDLGGGLGICYNQEQPPAPQQYVEALLQRLAGRSQQIMLEPGRAIVGNAGILLTRVEYLKPTASKNFAVVDAAMNDLIRPALYSAWQDIQPAQQHASLVAQPWDIVGPVCETGDFLGKQRELALQQGDLLAVRSAGAYGFTMSSNYNSRPRVAEIMVDGEHMHVIRERESIEHLWAGEHLLP
jgi:diaminopimelate decarboxylase